MPTEPAARLIAFYLPQFFPIPENDRWWGPGFTEWTNVAKARRLFPGHWQPHIPADLGFYDLRVPETRDAQARLARDCGVEGFAYWHYWFGNGRRILERPFDEVLASGSPDLPFCLAWANQSWTGIWHGLAGTTLLEQRYPGEADFKAHFDWCLTAFRDPRYMRVDGKPIFVLFAPHDFPSTDEFCRLWRGYAEAAGLPGLYLVGIANHYAPGRGHWDDPIYLPFDAMTPLAPHDYLDTHGTADRQSWRRRVRELNGTRYLNWAKGGRLQRPTRIRYADVVRHTLNDLPTDGRALPCVLPNWDNTPRSGTRGVVFEGATPALYADYLRKALRLVAARPREQRIVFLKAWNEWAEGNYIEPDTTHGHGYLDATRSVMLG